MIDAQLQLDGVLARVPFVAIPNLMPGQDATLTIRVRGIPLGATVVQMVMTAKKPDGSQEFQKNVGPATNAATTGIIDASGANGMARARVVLQPADLIAAFPTPLTYDVWCVLSDGRKAPCLVGTVGRENAIATSIPALVVVATVTVS